MSLSSNHGVSAVRLEVPERMWQRFRAEMLAVRESGEELLGLFFCTRHDLPDGTRRLLPRHWIVPTRECYDFQGSGGLALNQDVHRFLLEQYLDDSMDVVHIHTHPGGGRPHFSATDDEHERRYAEFLGKLDPPRWLISGVYDESMELSQFRAWAPFKGWSGQVALGPSWDSRTRGFSASEARGYDANEQYQDSDDWGVLDRQRVFGAEAQRQLSRLRVALVGCGGIGSVVAEQLARLGIRNWLLVDPDTLDCTNLNRMPGATAGMVRQHWSKVRYVRSMIKRACPDDVEVEALRAELEDPTAQNAIAACDLIVVATDNHSSRLMAQRVAALYLRPLLSIGTHIDVSRSESKEVSVRAMARVTIPPVDGGWCLICGDVIDPSEASREKAPLAVAEQLEKAGYLKGVAAPAVYWLNSLAASAAVGMVHGHVSGFISSCEGIDWIFDYGRASWMKLQHRETQECLFCSPDGYLAKASAP